MWVRSPLYPEKQMLQRLNVFMFGRNKLLALLISSERTRDLCAAHNLTNYREE